MSANMLPSLAEDNRDLRKQIGCMNGIFQIFDRQHFITGRRLSKHNHKRLLLGAQDQLDPQGATNATTEKDHEARKEKPRMSMESSRASCSSSSSSTFSSLDSNRTAQTEKLSLRQISIPETPFQIKAMKELKHSLAKGSPSLDLRGVVKDSMHREPRCLSIKSPANDERQGHPMKHIDSPRPLQQPKSGKPKAIGYEGSTRIVARVQESPKNPKDERLTPPRFSYDGRESRESFKSAMKLKELPRFSLDSKASLMKFSDHESRLNFPRRELQTEKEKSTQVRQLNQELGSHSRSSSIVAKLMGLEAFPDDMSTGEKSIPEQDSSPKGVFLPDSSTIDEGSRRNQLAYSPRLLQDNPTSPSPRLNNGNSVRKPTASSRFPIEPAPWKQQHSSQVSPKMSPHGRKVEKDTPYLSCSVYGEMEKRITQLEFKKSGKDLRALKQILEAMQKTRERLESQIEESPECTLRSRCSTEDRCSDQISTMSMWNEGKGNHQVPTIRRPGLPKQSGSSIVIMKPVRVMDKRKNSSPNQVLQMESPHQLQHQSQGSTYHKENSAQGQKAKDLTQRSNHLKDTRLRLDKKTTSETSGLDQTSSVSQCTTSAKSLGMVSPRLQKSPIRPEGRPHPTTSPSYSSRVKKDSSKTLVENDSLRRKHKVKTREAQLSDDQSSELSTDTRYSSYQGDTASVKSESTRSLASQTETEVVSFAQSSHTGTKQKEVYKKKASDVTECLFTKNYVSITRDFLPTVELAVTVVEQPSPVSVLDASFYGEDSPSPIKKISTAFRDERLNPDEAEWHFEKQNHSTERATSGHDHKDHQKIEETKHLVHEHRLLNSEPDETLVQHNTSAYGSLYPDHIYISKILLTSGLLRDVNFISTAYQSPSSCHVINPEMFHVLEQTESTKEGAEREQKGKNDQKKLIEKCQRKIIFDLVNEILVSKITSGRLFTGRRKRTSPEGLLKEVYSEIDRLHRTPDSSHGDEDDELIRLLTADMMYQPEDWANCSGEIPDLVLDIERLIFKDLINEVVTGEVMSLNEWPRKHCKQLFSK